MSSFTFYLAHVCQENILNWFIIVYSLDLLCVFPPCNVQQPLYITIWAAGHFNCIYSIVNSIRICLHVNRKHRKLSSWAVVCLYSPCQGSAFTLQAQQTRKCKPLQQPADPYFVTKSTYSWNKWALFLKFVSQKAMRNLSDLLSKTVYAINITNKLI